MFKNVGKAIKGIAKALFVIYLIIGILAAIAALVVGIYYGANGYGAYYTIYGILAFVGIIIFSFIGAYLSVMIMYAFGSITDDVKTIKETLQGMQSRPANVQQPTYRPAPVAPAAPAPAPAPADEVKDEVWKCGKCGHENAKGNFFCENCGNGKDQ